MITQLLRPKSGQLDIHFSSYQQKPRFLAKNSKVWSEKVKVVHNLANFGQINKKMLSAMRTLKFYNCAKFQVNQLSGFRLRLVKIVNFEKSYRISIV